MARIIRTVMSFFVSMLISSMLERMMNPKLKQNRADIKDKVEKKPYLDMKPCPACGAYTTQPCSNPNCTQH